MDFNLVFSLEAEIEFNAIDCFFSATSNGRNFHKDFHLQMMRLKANPYQFQIRYRDVRIVHLKRFNYSIHYIITEQRIVVLRILNQYQSY